LCHEPARKEKNGRRRNRHESIKRDGYILWKTLGMSSNRLHRAHDGDRNPQKCGVFLPIHSQAASRHGGVAAACESDARRSPDFVGWMRGNRAEKHGQNERPVRGDNRTGQAIWALGVDGRSRRIQPRWGGITAPTQIGRGRTAARSNGVGNFLTSWKGAF
jgi:hypothetical protein